MKKSKRILKVPKESFLRNTLRKEAQKLAVEENLLPPVPFALMEQLAIGLLQRLNISDEYIDFTIVLLGNESWRKTVEATPFNRRLLLLPQCLKNNTSCKGQFDSLGLNCAGCKACPIDDILLEAEGLGYATLVAEGTTVAIGLVEEGAIDAVIGVSCMPVLQRSFEPVSNAAVPVIGLPLMYDGCENTKIDMKWLADEIKCHKSNENHKPISISGMKVEIKDFFANGKLDTYFSENDETGKLAREYLQVGGQRIRPLLAVLACSAYGSGISSNLLDQLALIIECFHKASLIHDDIEDEADYRYERETAHKKYGVAKAINSGDYLIGLGYRLLAGLPVQSSVMSKALLQVSNSHVKLTQGQGADIAFNAGENALGVDETLTVFRNKTGEAIKVALLLGAIVGEAADAELEKLSTFADYMGISYQIRDDLNEYQEKAEHEKIADFPFLVALLNDSNNDVSYNSLSEFRAVVNSEMITEKAQDMLEVYVRKCYAELDKLENAKLRLSLYGILGKIFKPLRANE